MKKIKKETRNVIGLVIIILVLIAMNFNNTYQIHKMTKEDIRTKDLIKHNTNMLHYEAIKRNEAISKLEIKND